MATRIIEERKAGKSHAVITVVGGDGTYCKQPCEECPWRVDRTGNFPAKAFEHSANTAYDMSDHTFACHMAGSDRPKICAGFLLNGSVHNLTVRIGVAKGAIDFHQVSNGGCELHKSYRAMADANGVSPDSEQLRRCR